MANLNIGVAVNNTGALQSLNAVNTSIANVGQTATQTSTKTNKALSTISTGMKHVKTGAEAASKAVKAVGSALSGPAGIIAGLATGGSVFAMFSKSINNGSALYKLNQATGMSIKSLEKFRVMVGLAGGSIDDLKDGIQTFSERMGEAAKDTESEWAKRFKDMGINVTGSVDDAMTQMLRSLAKMVDGGKRAQAWWIGNDIFGGAWEKMSAMVSGGTKGLELQLKKIENAKIFDERKVLMMQSFKEKIDSLKNSLLGFAVEISEKVLPIIDGLFKSITGLFGINTDNLKYSGNKVGREFAKGFLKGFEYITGKDGLAIKLVKGFNIIKGVMLKIGAVLGKLFNKDSFKNTLDYIFSSLKVKMLEIGKFLKSELAKTFDLISKNMTGQPSTIFKSISNALSGLYEKTSDKSVKVINKLNSLGSGANVSISQKSYEIIGKYANSIAGTGIKIDPLLKFNKLNLIEATNALIGEYNKLDDANKKGKKGKTLLEDITNLKNEVKKMPSVYTKVDDVLQSQIDSEKQRTKQLEKNLGLTSKFLEIDKDVISSTNAGIAVVNKFNANFYDGMAESTKTTLGLSRAIGGVISEVELSTGEDIRRRIKGESKAFLEPISMINDKGEVIKAAKMRRLEPIKRQSVGDELDLGELFNLNADDIAKAMQERLDKQKEYIGKMFEIGSVGIDMLQILADRRKAINDREMSDLEKRQQAELNGIEVTATKRSQLEAKNLQEREALAAEHRKKEKAWAIAQIQIDTATAIGQLYMGAVGSGAKFGVKGALTAMAFANIMAGMLTAKGLAQTAMIANYAEGGIVPGNSYTGDNVRANVNSGEMIINKQDQSTLFNAIKSGNLGGNAPVIHHSIVIQGNITEDKMQQLQVNQNQFLNDLENGVKKLKAYGRLKNIF